MSLLKHVYLKKFIHEILRVYSFYSTNNDKRTEPSNKFSRKFRLFD